MKAHPYSLRSQVINDYKNNKGSMLKIACRYGVSRSFVQKIIKQEKELGHINPLADRSKINQMSVHQQTIKSLLAQQPDITLASLCDVFQEKTGMKVSVSTMCRFLQRIQ